MEKKMIDDAPETSNDIVPVKGEQGCEKSKLRRAFVKKALVGTLCAVGALTVMPSGAQKALGGCHHDSTDHSDTGHVDSSGPGWHEDTGHVDSTIHEDTTIG